jgi:iron complex transport system permease protein
MARPASFSHDPLTPNKLWSVLLALFLLLVIVSVIALSVGSVRVPFSSVVDSLLNISSVPDAQRTIVMAVRLPRVLLAIVVGAGLALAGVVLQALLRNPLAEPYILGISSGGTMGMILALTVWGSFALVGAPLASFAGSALVMLMVYGLAQRRGQLDPYTLLLSGVMVGAFFNAAVLLTVAVFNQELRNAFLWLMGNLSGARADSLYIVGPLVLVGTVPILWRARDFNLIATGDETAMQLGIDVRSFRRFAYLVASFLTGVVVSVSGVIGFVGLLIPHIGRMIFGPDHRLLLPASFLLGASFLVVADTVARTIISPAEIPVGAVTAAIGAPVFIYLLRKV